MDTSDHTGDVLNNIEAVNTELAKEAVTTKDTERQQQLAKHPSAIVRWHLAQNQNLSSEAIDALGGLMEVERLRKITSDAVGSIDKK
jgi:hypothetical protein